MSLYSSTHLKGLSQSITLHESERMVSETRSKRTFLFLSRRFLDREEVKGLYPERTRMGHSISVTGLFIPSSIEVVVPGKQRSWRKADH